MHRATNEFPKGSEIAWTVFHALDGPAVKRFGLQREALEAAAGELDAEALVELLGQLDAIADGIARAGQQE